MTAAPTHAAHATMPISKIKIGNRHRRDMGDLAAFAVNIADIGLLHPIVVRPDGMLIAGVRRLEAAKRLGWTEIPATVVDVAAIVRGEFAENAFRKDFAPSEAVAIKRALEPIERAEAKRRQGTRTDKHPGKLPTSSKGRAADKAAKATGMARRTLEKAEEIVDAAAAEPEKFGKLLDDMDRSGRVNGPYRRLRNTKQAEAIRAEPPPLPNKGPYRVAVCDAPWPYEPDDADPADRGAWPFPTLSLAQLCALPVSSIMHTDAILWFWVTNFHMRQAFAILAAWSFHETPTILTWTGPRIGSATATGCVVRPSTASSPPEASRSSRSPTRALGCTRRCVATP
jgi:ParB family chromosome partitioning protein